MAFECSFFQCVLNGHFQVEISLCQHFLFEFLFNVVSYSIMSFRFYRTISMFTSHNEEVNCLWVKEGGWRELSELVCTQRGTRLQHLSRASSRCCVPRCWRAPCPTFTIWFLSVSDAVASTALCVDAEWCRRESRATAGPDLSSLFN